MHKLFIATLTIIVSLSVTGCLLAEDAKKTPEKDKPATMTVTGIVVHKFATKSVESFDAGESEYCVIYVDHDNNENTPDKGYILRPTEKVTFDTLKKYAGKKVTVTGVYSKGKPIKPQPGAQYPIRRKMIRDKNGKIKFVDALPIRGSGIKVQKIEFPK